MSTLRTSIAFRRRFHPRITLALRSLPALLTRPSVALGISRSDFIVSEDGPVILETNTIPGMTDTSLYPDEIRHTDDMTFPQVCDSLIRMGLRRAGIAC